MTILSPAHASYGILRRAVQAGALAVAAALALAGPAAAKPLRLVAFGDSLTAGYGLPPGQAFPDVLARALKARGWDVEVVNAGVSGDTAADGLARFDWSVPDNANAIIVELGANDMLRGLDPAAAEVSLSHILDKARAGHMAILLAGMRAAPNYGEDYKLRFEAIYSDLAQKFDVTLYPFFLEGVAGNRPLQLGDGLHPNRAGVEHIVEAILPSVETVLKQAKPAQAKP
jgi:acyl-CoA thioesterase-1